jgi:SAM-dependent methyltransferase
MQRSLPLWVGALFSLLSHAALAVQGDEAPFVTTPLNAVKRMLTLAGTGPDDVVYDLGSGDGRIVIAAARDFGAQGVGVEIDPGLIKISKFNARKEGVAEQTRFLHADLFDMDYSAATVVTMFLRDDVNMRLQPRLWKQLKPGSKVVTYRYGMGDLVPVHDEMLDGERIRLWVVPAQSGE